MARTRLASLGPLVAAALWGGMYVVSKWGFGAIPPLTLAFLRVLLAAAVLAPLVAATTPSRSFSRRDYRGFALLGLWVALTLATQFVGTDLTNASQGSLLTVLTPVFTLALGVALHGEALTARKVGGMAFAGIGTTLVLAGQYDLSTLFGGGAIGPGLLLVASLGWAAYTVHGKRLVRTYSPLETATYSTLVAVPLLAILVPVEFLARGLAPGDVPVTLGVVGAVVYLGVLSTAAAWVLWYAGLETLDAGTVAVYFFAQPVVGAALGAALLDEPLGPLFVAGGATMAAGVYLVDSARTGEPPAPEETGERRRA